MSEDLKQNVTIKNEPESDPLDAKPTSLEKYLNLELKIDTESQNLYEGHEIKLEIVVGPETLQQSPDKKGYSYSEEIIEDPAQNNHLQMTYSEKLFLCKLCHEYFTSLRLKEHIALDHGKEQKQLSVDLKQDLNPKDRTNATQSECSNKSKIFKVRRHFKCDICEQIFIQKSSLRSHMKRHIEKKPFSCKICSKKFAHQRYLKQHIMIHSHNQPYSCKHCSKSFRTASLLRRHIFYHTGETKALTYKCKFCDRSFLDKHSLDRHLRKHTDERPFQCGICKKAFKEKSTLKRHKIVHMAVNIQYTCEICDRCFLYSHNLTRHMRKHTDERPYQCSICKMTFRESGTLKRHERTHTGKNYECDICSKMYVQKYYLQCHILSAHMKKKLKKKKVKLKRKK